MSAIAVCDASALVALLTDNGPDGSWATAALAGAELAAPQLLPFEVSNVLRRLERTGILDAVTAAQAHADLLDLTIELWPYEALAARTWELRNTLTAYDAGYVAVAELLGASVVTLDRGISSAPGVRCDVRCP